MANVVTVDRKQFVDNLMIIANTIKPDSTNLNDSSNYLIIQDGALCCVANQFAVRIPMGLDLDSLINVEFRLLFDYVRKLKTKEIKLGITTNGTLGLLADKSRVEFAVTDAFSYDTESLISDDDDRIQLPESFINALQFTAWACNVADMSTAYVIVNDGKMYGMNMKDRVSCYDMQDAGITAFPENTAIHADVLPFVTKYMSFEATKSCPTYTIKNSWLHLKTNSGVILSSRTRADVGFDAEFVEDLLGDGDNNLFRFNKEFTEILDRANPFSGKDSKVKKVTVRISNSMQTKRGMVTAPADSSFLALTACREDGSRIYEECTIRRVNNPVQFTVGFNLLMELVKYGEWFQLAQGRLLCTGVNSNGTAEGKNLFRAMCTLRDEE